MSSSGYRTSGLRFEPLELHDDPYPIYRRLRDECPVYDDPEGRFCGALAPRGRAGGGARLAAVLEREGNDLDEISRSCSRRPAS